MCSSFRRMSCLSTHSLTRQWKCATCCNARKTSIRACFTSDAVISARGPRGDLLLSVPTHQFFMSLSIPYFENSQPLLFLRRPARQNFTLFSVASFLICQILSDKSAFLTFGLTHSYLLQDSPSNTPKLWVWMRACTFLPRLRIAAMWVYISALLIVCRSSNFASRVPSMGVTSCVAIQLDHRPSTCTMP